jgi:hypothetical protein
MLKKTPENKPQLKLYQRKSLDQITDVPDDIISVYVVEQHIWANANTEEERSLARKTRQAETRTIKEFLIDPVRPFLMDFFRQLSAPYEPNRKDNPIGQGYWIQAEFGSGKSHLLSFVGALALGGEKEWEIVRKKEEEAGRGKRESLAFFYENGLQKKTKDGKGILIAVKTLVGQGSINTAGDDKTLGGYILDAVAEQFYLENGKSLPLYPEEILAERFLSQDVERYSKDLQKYLQDPAYFDEENRMSLEEFLDELQNNQDPGVQRDLGQKLWDFYDRYLRIRPKIETDVEDVLKHMVQRLLDEGYAGLLLILDEVSLFMKGRSDKLRSEDEKALVVLSNRLAKVENLPVWTVCAAQQAIETKLVGVKNIIADERLKLVPLLNKQEDYYDIALARVRTIKDAGAIEQYYEDYKRGFSWPQAEGRDKFERFFPFYPPAIDVVRAVSYNLTTIRSALYFMLQTVKAQRKLHSNELITLWCLFDDVVNYTEDPSGTSRSIASVKTKFPTEWRAYEDAKRQIDEAISGPLKAYRSRSEKIVKTLFLYHIANLSPDGLSHEEIMNCVMEWKDQDAGQTSDLQDNRDHYELLVEKLDTELVQVEKVGSKYRFNVQGTGPNPVDVFQRARAEAEASEVLRRDAWHQLLSLDGWQVNTNFMTLDLASGISSIFREIAPESQKDITIRWHGREIDGRVYMKNLQDTSRRSGLLPNINSPDTGLDFAVFISNTPLAVAEQDKLLKEKADPRALFWTPDPLTTAEQSLLIDFTAYRTMVAEAIGKDTEQAKAILDWVQGRLTSQMGTIYRIVPESFGRGRISALDHSQITFQVQGELAAILSPLVGQVLDSTYVCRDIEIEFPAPFNDVNAVNVINGIVKAGEFPRSVKVSKEVSASQNYGFAIRIMRKPNDHKLDLRDCRYTTEIMKWIEEKLGDTGASMVAGTIYKNFMGINGPNGINYGLSKRMVQMYLLCLVREGRIRITLSGRNLPAEVVDYSNIAALDFKVALLDAFDQVQRLKPPEGWEVLAPFAAILLQDDSVKNVREDAEIQKTIQRILEYKIKALESFRKFHHGLVDLFIEWERPFGSADRLVAWEQFLTSPVEASDPISYLRNGLEKAFGFPIYHDETVRPEDLDDLTTRRLEVEQAECFYGHKERLRASMRYFKVEIPDDPSLEELKRTFQALGDRIKNLDTWVFNETRLLNEFLEPMGTAIETYKVRYLQAFDKVVSHTEQVRQKISELDVRADFTMVAALGSVRSLGSDTSSELQRMVQAKANDELFPTKVTRAVLDRELSDRPKPDESPLTLDNGLFWIQKADTALQVCSSAIESALLEKARLLHSPALRERLEQGKGEKLIAGLLKAKSPGELAKQLVSLAEKGQGDELVRLFNLYLKKVRVQKVRMADFKPAKRTLELVDVDVVAEEFKSFVMDKFTSKGDDEITIVEIE